MFIVILRFSSNRAAASRFMAGHKEWIARGFDEQVFALVGSLQPEGGGVILALNTSLSELRDRVNADPFVAEHVVTAEILEVAPSRVDERLNLLLGRG